MKARREAFIKHMIDTGNGAESARLAGYAVNSARITGSQLLSVASIREAVDKGLKEKQEQYIASHALVEQNLLKIAQTAERDEVRRQAWMDIAKLNGYIKETAPQQVVGIYSHLIGQNNAVASGDKATS